MSFKVLRWLLPALLPLSALAGPSVPDDALEGISEEAPVSYTHLTLPTSG